MLSKEEFEAYFGLRGKVNRRIDEVINIIAEVRELNDKFNCHKDALWSITHNDQWSVVTKYGKDTIIELEVYCYCVPDLPLKDYKGPVQYKFKFDPEYLFWDNNRVILAEKFAENKRQILKTENDLLKLQRNRKLLVGSEKEELKRLLELYGEQ